MAGASTSTYEINSMVQGHHVYKTIWTPLLSEALEVGREDDNDLDEYAVAITRREVIVGHVPREISRVFYYFLGHSSISCRITGHGKKGIGLVVPCVYTFCSSATNIKKLSNLLAKCKNQSDN